MAHVTYFEGAISDGILPPGAIQIALRTRIAEQPAFSLENIDVTAYPYAALDHDRTPCADALSAWTPDRRESLLDCAGEERLRVKSLRMEVAMCERGEEQVFYEEFMSALGYKHNQQPFRHIARVLPLESLRSAAGTDKLRGYALLAGIAGLLPSPQPGHDRETRTFLRSLWDCWWKYQSEWSAVSMMPSQWRTSGLRPQNNPIRRLAAAAGLFCTTPLIIEQLKVLPTADHAAWFHRAGRLITDTPGLDYWRRRLAFAGEPTCKESALIGQRRAAAILSNVVIPFLAANGVGIERLLDHLPPEQDNALVRQTAHALFGRDHNPAMYRRGLRQQGLLQIFHDFCIGRRTGCPECPLAVALADQQSG